MGNQLRWKECEKKNGLIMMGDLPRWKEYEVRSHCNGWPTQVNKRWRMVSFFGWPTQKKLWSHCDGWPTQVERGKSGFILWVTYPGERMASFFGWPTQIKKRWRMVSFLWVTYPEKKYSLIVMGDLPKEKGRVVSFFGWPTQGKEWPHSLGDLPM